ncbi:5-carboxymethyl-2-hydroxymuconate isomerase [Streptomyces aurantiacus]|uniref:5-carboxymethyl-2-hydroxymuconate Delta-isomerase n=1 Tax=Streptomyces aurantiacus TaxID=47760 RepID=UPI00279009AC|nr:isomerase [Streptomyces aurantiacus]MDQ0777732.1 5-carboxymethyl-2-hydroxymuconate isomerase [Streptomyces aurantiacus]
MPQITVDYSTSLTDTFDRQGFAVALHTMVVETAAAKIEACKSRFTAVDDVVVGAERAGHALVHVAVALLPGRSAEVKSALTSRTLELVRAHVKPVDGVTLHASAEVRDLEASYQKFED